MFALSSAVCRPMSLHAVLEDIFRSALARVDPRALIAECLRLDGRHLVVSGPAGRHVEGLARFERVIVLGAGKAAARMACGVEEALGAHLSGGLVVVKYGHAEPLRRIEVIEAAHPTPDAAGVRAARRIAAIADGADHRTLVIVLISGGASALLCAPWAGEGAALTLADKQAVTRLLLACGAEIGAINCVRKHLSLVKGGRLARRLAPARGLALILSDVVGDRLDVIASGPVSPDPSTFAQALGILDAYGVRAAVPVAVRQLLETGARGMIPETPKPGDPAFAGMVPIVIGNTATAIEAACIAAAGHGFTPVPLTARLTGEAAEVAKVLFAQACDVRDRGWLAAPPALLVAGGETTVTLGDSPPPGGRNQELALAALAAMAADGQRGAGIHLLAASTDGGDGTTDAAGAFASPAVLERVAAAGLLIGPALRGHAAHALLDAAGAVLRTGPTGTNVCDLCLIAVGVPPA